jgi:hypothetical protein
MKAVVSFSVVIVGLCMTCCSLVSSVYIQGYCKYKSKGYAARGHSVTVVMPVCGDEKGALAENIASVLSLNYRGQLNIVCCMESTSDPGYAVVTSPRFRNDSRVSVRIIPKSDHVGLNAKVNNMAQACDAARSDFVLLMDSNVKVQSPDWLDRMFWDVEQRSYKHSGLPVASVSGIVTGVCPSNFWGHMEMFILNGVHACYTMGTTLLYPYPILTGKCFLYRRSSFEQTTSWRELGKYLIEDAVLSESFACQSPRRWNIGFSSVIAPHNMSRGRTHGELSNRFVRWLFMRKSFEPTLYGLEWMFQSTICWSGVFAYFAHYCLGFATFSGCWLFAFVFNRLVSNVPVLLLNPADALRSPFWWLLSTFFHEAFYCITYMNVLLAKSVSWRASGEKFCCTDRARLIPVDSESTGPVEYTNHPMAYLFFWIVAGAYLLANS